MAQSLELTWLFGWPMPSRPSFLPQHFKLPGTRKQEGLVKVQRWCRWIGRFTFIKDCARVGGAARNADGRASCSRISYVTTGLSGRKRGTMLPVPSSTLGRLSFTARSVLSPAPSSALTFWPQHLTLPSSSSAHECPYPWHTLTGGISGPTWVPPVQKWLAGQISHCPFRRYLPRWHRQALLTVPLPKIPESSGQSPGCDTSRPSGTVLQFPKYPTPRFPARSTVVP